MKTIYKYSIPITDFFSLNLPMGAKILAFQTQGGLPVIWAIVNPENELEEREFCIRGTGHPDNSGKLDNDIYIGTIQTGILVWHLFEQKGG
ncbi:hypothetical protein KA005_71670 [bacterium]|nr:hypothetical protein [bacterium]